MGQRDATGRFVKGVSGNPAGRSKKEREYRFYEIAVTTVTFTDWRDIIEKAITQAKRGDSIARKFLADYLMGPPVNKVEVSDPTINVVIDWGEAELSSGEEVDND